MHPQMNNAAQDQSSVADQASRSGSNTWVRLCIFLGFAVAFIVVAIRLIPSGADVERSVELTTRIALQAGLAGWALCWTIAGKWLTLKKTALIALSIYIGIGFWLWYLRP